MVDIFLAIDPMKRIMSSDGHIRIKQMKKQGYSKNRTIGNKVKQRWLNEYSTSTVEFTTMSQEDYDILADLFYASEQLLIFDTMLSKNVTGYITGDTLGFADFMDEFGNVAYRGTIEMEE